MKEYMMPKVVRARTNKNPPLTYTADNLGLTLNNDNSDYGLLQFLYSIIDYQIINELGQNVPMDYIKRKVPYNLTKTFFRNGLPRNKTINKLLYDYIYNEITYPLFVENFGDDPYIPNNYHARSVVEQNGRTYADSESKLLTNYLLESLLFVQSLSSNVVIDTELYLKTIQENPLLGRKRAMRLAMVRGEIPAIRSPLMNMNGMVNNIKGYIAKTSEFESVIYANSVNLYTHGDRIYVDKSWIWSGKKKTRHRGMDGVTVDVNDPFLVVNERTGEACELMYPRDYNRDPSGANTNHCGCEVSYNENKELKKKWLI